MLNYFLNTFTQRTCNLFTKIHSVREISSEKNEEVRIQKNYIIASSALKISSYRGYYLVVREKTN